MLARSEGLTGFTDSDEGVAASEFVLLLCLVIVVGALIALLLDTVV